jgi:glutamate N-acetyltransferase/amino-acid N-acetyltransferase
MNAPLPRGFRAAGIRCGIKAKPDALDLGLLLSDEAAPAWALFTKNRLHGAHIEVCRDHLARGGGLVRAVLVNSGNANCATGPEGVADARRLCATLADRVGCPSEQVLMVSTGVIGARLDADRVEGALDALLAAASPDGGPAFARAIMTTDTVPKGRATDTPEGHRVTGFAKGSGMIHPDMATMLAFLLTDASVSEGGATLRRVADRSFHRTTVDGDTSPNDTLLMWAGGSETDGFGTDEPEATLTSVARALARAIARDGEGATRLVTIHVSGAEDEAEAAHIGRAIARSPLVKTAITGRDPNWGRILSAACSAGVPVDPETARLAIGEVLVYRDGRPVVENEPAAHEHLATRDEVHLSLTLTRGRGAAEVWTCDFTADYVEINAHYRS